MMASQGAHVLKANLSACWMHRHSELSSRPQHCSLYEGDPPHPVPVCWERHGGRWHQAAGGEFSAQMPAGKHRGIATAISPVHAYLLALFLVPQGRLQAQWLCFSQ